jgi:hypothetical protein
MPHRRQQGHPAAERVAHHVRLAGPEVIDQRRDVIGHEPDVERPVDVGGPAVPLQVDGDDLVALRQCGQDGPESVADTVLSSRPRR